MQCMAAHGKGIRMMRSLVLQVTCSSTSNVSYAHLQLHFKLCKSLLSDMSMFAASFHMAMSALYQSTVPG